MNPNWAVAVVLALTACAIFRALVRQSRRCDQIIAAARTRPEQQAPGTDTDLLLDAHLAYYGPAGLDQLQAAIDQHRKETP